MVRLQLACAALLLVVAARSTLVAAETEAAATGPQEPMVAGASEEAQLATNGFRVPKDLAVELFAAEPLLANPVAFVVDHRGNVWVCETFRQGKGVEDNREHAHWLDDDLAAQTVEDRLAYIRKHLGKKAEEYTWHDDRIRRLVDVDGDGKADSATVFADRFNGIEEGTGAGVLVRGSDVFYANIPHLWRLRDTDGDGVSDDRQKLHSGYGVRFAFRGHDLHGLILGPDGRLYFSIGDRGLNVVTREGKRLVNPQSGAVLRCELDGSNLELFATGLRNPQELAFDDYGNLFTGDNNSDSGDQARWVYVVQGGDSGWRMEYQYLPDRGPFNRESIWRPEAQGQPAYIIPPIANFASGPSGLSYYPGTGLPAHYSGRFFLADFRGGPANSGVRTFRLRPKGASFELVDEEETLWNVLATDVDFGPDGAIYLSDWVNGWNGEGKGRIYRYSSPELSKSPEVLEVKRLLGEGISDRSSTELFKLLAHADRRIRQEAQFALARQRELAVLAQAARSETTLPARLHGIWGLWQMGRLPEYRQQCGEVVVSVLADPEPEVRAQAAMVAGELRHAAAAKALLKLLMDDSPRVRYFGAVSLGNTGGREAIEPLLTMLAENDDSDRVLRHGGVLGLAGCASRGASLSEFAKHPSPAARLGVLLAMRRLRSEEISAYLDDSDPRLIVEAARAIHDLPVEAAMPKLARLISRDTNDDALLRRVLNANYRLGRPEHAVALAQFAARADAPEAMRLQALAMLSAWEKPSSKDWVLNFWRPLAPRDRQRAADALKGSLTGLFAGSSKVAAEGAKVAASLGIAEVGPELHRLFSDRKQPAKTRAEALTGLAVLGDQAVDDAVEAGLSDSSPMVRAAARRALMERRPTDGIAALEEAVFSGEKVERQSALGMLADTRAPQSLAILSKALDRLLAGDFPLECRLDLLEAASRKTAPELAEKLEIYRTKRDARDPLSQYRECLDGGDPEKGRQIFFERAQVSCVRCHKVGGTGGDVGPELTRIAHDKSREHLLEALVDPNKTIAKGFETVVIRDLDGQIHTGIVKLENEQQMDLMTAEGRLVSVPQDTIEARKSGKSAMPEELTKHLSRFDLRDLVEFLSTCR